MHYTRSRYDNGISLNPKIDIGQIEGGLVMSMGWHLTEEIVSDGTTGVMKSNGTWGAQPAPAGLRRSPPSLSLFLCFSVSLSHADYHPPQSKDIPIELNLHLLPNKPNAAGIMSKFVGEPPMILANAVTFALKNAVYAARKDSGDSSYFQLDIPATPEKLQTL